MRKLNLSIKGTKEETLEETLNKLEETVIEMDVELKLVKGYDESIYIVTITKNDRGVDNVTYLLQFRKDGTIVKFEQCFASGFKCDPINGELLFSKMIE